MKWSEQLIAGALARQVFNRSATVVVPRCGWTGHECDLLVVEKRLRLIDVEIKISRQDLAADRKKDKWWKATSPRQWLIEDGVRVLKREQLQWPPQIWKHYYALPADIWKPEMTSLLPGEESGILLLDEDSKGGIRFKLERHAKINRAARPIEAADALDIARLCTLRMWDSYQLVAKAKEKR